MRWTLVPVLLLAAAECGGAEEAAIATRMLEGHKTAFPAASVAEGVKALIAGIESCSSDDWASRKPPEVADLVKAQQKEHVQFVFAKPVSMKVMGNKLEVSEVI